MTRHHDQEPDPSDQLDRFDQALRTWADRPPTTDPNTAARRVTERIEPRRPGMWGLWRAWPLRLAGAGTVTALAAAVVVMALIVAGLANPGLLDRFGDPETAPVLAGPPAALDAPVVDDPPPLPEGVVVIALDATTDLYLTLTPPETTPTRGDRS